MADDDIYAALMRFHREIIVPEIRDPLHEQIRATENLRNEMQQRIAELKSMLNEH